MWWKSAVNFASLLPCCLSHTGQRTRRAYFCGCVRDAFCWLVFSLARPLPSIPSAAACAALFGDFVGTTGLSDSPRPSIIGLRPPAFPMRPTSLHVRVGSEGVSRFSRRKIPLVLWGLRPRGVSTEYLASDIDLGRCGLPRWLSLRRHPGFPSVLRFHGPPARAYPCRTLHRHPRGWPAHDLGAVVGRYSFDVRLSHPHLSAGLSRALRANAATTRGRLQQA